MNLTVAQEEWLQALESGDYNQVTGMLKKGDVWFLLSRRRVRRLGRRRMER